jgi:hypothetical protein
MGCHAGAIAAFIDEWLGMPPAMAVFDKKTRRLRRRRYNPKPSIRPSALVDRRQFEPPTEL